MSKEHRELWEKGERTETSTDAQLASERSVCVCLLNACMYDCL